MRIFDFFRRIRYPRRVLVHTQTGDLILPVRRGNIILVPWMFHDHYCPFHLEPDGKVTLRLMWGDTPSRGYGRVWDLITWEPLVKNV